ncbi:MAG: response regulator transcription factor [Desulfobacteraceae bacterium]|nr:response regulator transcription factor [Desulfobacteraceae bacterium]
MQLTKREQEVVYLLARGLSLKEISQKLSISMNTVKSHRTNIMRKTGTKNTVELIRYAAKAGLADYDLW